MTLERVPDLKPVKANAHHGPAAKEPPPKGKVLAIQSSAVLDTGRRQVAYRLNDDGAYEMVELKLGPRATGKDDPGRLMSYYPVLSGLQPGQFVVVRGGFLLDSQRQIEGMPSLLHPGGQSGASLHSGHPAHGSGAAPPSGKPPDVHKH
jgi:hypothetical protein